MAKRQRPKSTNAEEVVEVVPGVFSDEAEDREVAEERRRGAEKLDAEDQLAEDQDEADNEPIRWRDESRYRGAQI